ncbi:MAG: hypothetical protein QOD99_358, partial [Chthoniobacter sp.]|nr:hypothetical protein [Chthoniobacter sp.]
MPECDQLSIRRELMAGFFAQLTQRGFANCALVVLGIFVDLPGWKFPDRRTDWDAFLAHEEVISLAGKRGND